MPTYLPDTNVLVDLGRDPAVQTKLENVEQSGSTFVIAPSTMTELTVGVVKGGATYFEQNKKIFSPGFIPIRMSSWTFPAALHR
jgi:hypothetical protein